MIYFTETYHDGKRLVKIGKSNTPASRRNTLQTGCPSKLNLLFSKRGESKDEANLKRKFRRFRVMGEWFRVEGELEAYIDRHLLVYG